MSDKYENQCEMASRQLGDYFGHAVGYLSVSDGVRIIIARIIKLEADDKRSREMYSKLCDETVPAEMYDELKVKLAKTRKMLADALAKADK